MHNIKTEIFFFFFFDSITAGYQWLIMTTQSTQYYGSGTTKMLWWGLQTYLWKKNEAHERRTVQSFAFDMAQHGERKTEIIPKNSTSSTSAIYETLKGTFMRRWKKRKELEKVLHTSKMSQLQTKCRTQTLIWRI